MRLEGELQGTGAEKRWTPLRFCFAYEHMGGMTLTLESDFALAAGVCLYLLTGMIGGIPILQILSRYFNKHSVRYPSGGL